MDAGLVAPIEGEWRCSTSEERRFSSKKKAPVKVPRVVLFFSLPENRERVSIYAHPLTGIYAVREWRMPTLG